MIVTLSGVDGSGKTTIGKLLMEELKGQGLNVVYRVEFNYFLLGYLKSFFNFITGNKKASTIIKKKVLIDYSYPKIIGSIWAYLTFLDLLLEYLYFKVFKRKTIIIMDRCIYDFLVGWEWIGYSNKFIRWLYLKFPKYALSYVLDIDPKIAYERKKDEQSNDLYFFSTLRNMYLIFFKDKKKIVFLNGSDNRRNLVKKITDDILNYNKQG